MSGVEASAKAARFEYLSALSGLRSSAASTASDRQSQFWIPGRIEVLGKHTDYGGGRSLLCAIERGICVIGRANDSHAEHPRISVVDANSSEATEFSFAPDVASRPGHWSNYAITVARRVASNFSASLRGTDIVFSSDLPSAAGVSSSSALVVAVFKALAAVNDLAATPEFKRDIVTCEDLAGYLGSVENGLNFKGLPGQLGVGTFGGSEDHTAILCARTGALAQFSFCPVAFERAVTLPSECCFIIGSSGVRAEKTGAALDKYNHVSRRLTVGFDLWRNSSQCEAGAMGAAVRTSEHAPAAIRHALSEVQDAEFPSESLIRRFDQFLLESEELIPSASAALDRGDLEAFGDIVARSQAAAESALENQIPQTVGLVASARALGAVAASAFGAGFGGSVWALVRVDASDEFMHRWKADYATAFPDESARADFFRTRAGPAAMQI